MCKVHAIQRKKKEMFIVTTGLIEQLKEYDYNVERWLTECLPRQFGLFCHLRDDGNMTVEEMLKSLRERDSLKKPEMPVRYSNSELLNKFNKRNESYKKTIKERKEAKKKYLKVVETMNKLDEFTASELALAVIKLANQQLELVSGDFDTEHYEKYLTETFEEFVEGEEESYRYCMKRYLEEYDKYQKELLEKGDGKYWALYSNYLSEIKSLMKGLDNEE